MCTVRFEVLRTNSPQSSVVDTEESRAQSSVVDTEESRAQSSVVDTEESRHNKKNSQPLPP